MSPEDEGAAAAEVNENGAKPANGAVKEPVSIRPVEKKPPQKPLPTNRIAFPKQLELLRAFAAASGDERKAVTLKDVSEIVKIAADTISVANRFFLPVGLVSKGGDQRFTPCEAIRAYALSVTWSDPSAAHKLAPQLMRGWYWPVLEPFLRMGTLQEGEAINKLAIASVAGPSYQPQLMLILSYLDAAGLIQREGKTLRLGPTATGSAPSNARVSAPTEDTAEPPPAEERQLPSQNATTPAGAVATVFNQEPEGAFRVMVSLNFTMKELAGWRPELISALFSGVSQILTAKAAVEKESARRND